MAKKPPKKSLSSRAAHDPALLKRVLANPGLRSKLSDAQLPPAMRAKRQLNARLNAPVTPGSSMTYRDQARTANAQTQVRYGDAEQALGSELGHAQGLQRDTGDWYEQYKADLAQHAQNVNTIGGQATTALSNQAAGIRGLDQAALNAQQGAANADAAQRGTTAGNLGPDASNASTVRQALLAAAAGGQAGANAANSTYADTLAHVVAPGQKLQALAGAASKVGDVRSKQTALAKEKGAFNQSARDSITADEVKNVLTNQALNLNTAKATAGATTAAARVGETTRHNLASESNAAAARRTTAAAKAAAGDHYGYTNAEWATKNPAQRAAAAKRWKDTTGKPTKPKVTDPATADAKAFYAKYGVKPAPTAAVNRAKDDVQTASTWLKNLGGPSGENGRTLTTGQPAGKNPDGSARPAIPKMSALWVRVAMDLAKYHGKISGGTASRLHKAGYSVKTLGLATTAPSSPAAKLIPGVGQTLP